MFTKLSKIKMAMLAVGLAGVYFTAGLIVSIMPPFYPLEAERRGASPSQYGFVFGIFHLASLLTAPIFGAYGSQIGPRFLFVGGEGIKALLTLAFGLLVYVEDLTIFLTFSYVLRLLAGIVESASWGAVLGMLINMFPDRVGSITSYSETFFGLGYVLGPGIGSILYSWGGFGLPFYISGAIAMAFTVLLLFATSNICDQDKVKQTNQTSSRPLTTKNVLKSPLLLLPYIDLTVTTTIIGFLESMLAGHLEKTLDPTTYEISTSFLLLGLTYAVSMPVIGAITDHFDIATPVSLFSNVLMTSSLILIGPASFVPIQSTLLLTYGMCVTIGLTYGFCVVTSMTRAATAVKLAGYEETMETYLLTTGFYSCSFFLGNFLGSTIGGIFADCFGFQQSSVFFAACSLFMALLAFLEMRCPGIFEAKKKKEIHQYKLLVPFE